MISWAGRGDSTVITVADDFGLSPAVNEAVEQAARDGILAAASLMVAGDAAEDAVLRARRLPGLRVGLHLVVVEGPAVLAPAEIPGLVGADRWFPSHQMRLGFAYQFRPALRRQLAAEIRAQFEAFRRTGLPLDHANAHKHMHLHPVVGRLMIDIGREYGLRAIRIPEEPDLPGEAQGGLGAALLRRWCAVLRGQARRAGLITNDRIFGLRRSGHMTPDYVQRVLNSLPAGRTELYFHPATESDAVLRRWMPGYEHKRELEALLTARVPAGVRLGSYS